MTYKEFKEKHPNTATTTVWAADTKGGFGKKGWSVYGNMNDLEIIKIEPLENSWADVKLYVWDTTWGKI